MARRNTNSGRKAEQAAPAEPSAVLNGEIVSPVQQSDNLDLPVPLDKLGKGRGEDGLTDRERNLVHVMVKTGMSVVHAAKPAGFSDKQGALVAWKRDEVQDAFQKANRMALKELVPQSISTLKSLMENGKSELVRMQTAQDVIDRAGLGAPKEVQLAIGSINFQINLD